MNGAPACRTERLKWFWFVIFRAVDPEPDSVRVDRKILYVDAITVYECA